MFTGSPAFAGDDTRKDVVAEHGFNLIGRRYRIASAGFARLAMTPNDSNSSRYDDRQMIAKLLRRTHQCPQKSI